LRPEALGQQPPFERPIPRLEKAVHPDPKYPVVPPTGPVGSNFVEDTAVKDEGTPVTETLPNLITDFAGIPDLGLVIPPDPHMAVGPNHVMGVVNQQFAIYDKSGNLLKLINAADWFANVHPGGSPFDPQIVYDHHSGRWIMIWVDFNISTQEAWLLLSVSDDSNPLGIWCNWRLPGNQNGSTPNTLFNDYPKLGVDADAVYVTANMFDMAAGFAYRYVQLRIIPKAQLLTGSCGPVTWTDLWDLRNPSDLSQPTFTTVPAVTFGMPGVEYLVDVDFIHATGTFMNLWELTDPLGTPALTATTVPVAAFTDPPDAQQLGGGTPPIDVGGRRNRNVVFKDGWVWTAHSIADPTGQFARLRYVRIDATTRTAVEDVAFGADNFWYYYPAVQPDGANNLVIAFTRSGFTEYAGARYTGRLDSDPPGLSPSGLLKAGEDNYVKTFGTGRNRWGDYMGIALDPADNSKVWMLVEYAETAVGPGPNDDRWGTWFGCVTFGPPTCPPDIAVSPASFTFTVPVGGTAGDVLTISNVAAPGCDPLVWNITDQQVMLEMPDGRRLPVTVQPSPIREGQAGSGVSENRLRKSYPPSPGLPPEELRNRHARRRSATPVPLLNPTDSGFGPEGLNGVMMETVLNNPQNLIAHGTLPPGSHYAGAEFGNTGDFSFMYALDYNNNLLVTLDVATGTVTTIGPATPFG
ncbi:MAG: hypothetical protein D6681_15750, partial [Calditrichaeota bacterium]